MPLVDMLTEIHDIIMERIHKKRGAMANVNTQLLPKARKLVDQTIKATEECRVLWDGKQSYQVKWRGIGFCVNLQAQTCSCRVWDLTGIPCMHGMAAILYNRLNPLDFISSYYTKETYMKCYSNCLEVLNGPPFWEEVMGDTILPPPINKVLRGRPKKQRRKEGWEYKTSSSKPNKDQMQKDQVQRMTRVGRVMHCGNCNSTEHNVRRCPKPIIPKEQRKRKKRSRTAPNDEVQAEVEQENLERATGEADLMANAMEEIFTSQAPPPNDED